MKKPNVLLCLAILAAPTVSAADEVSRWYIVPQVGGLITDDDRDIEDGDLLLGLSIGRHIAERWSLELHASGAKLDSRERYAGSVDLLRVFRRNELLSPYLTLGAGAIRNEVDSARDDTDFMTQAGVGLIWKLGDNRRGTSSFALRPEVKVRREDAGRESFADYTATLGFQFSFGAPAPQPQALVTKPASTPPPPPPAPVAASPSDTDRDGVVDPADRCADSPRGVAVDASGCTQQGEITLAGVVFETNASTLTSDSLAVLGPVAANLEKYPELQIELQGHTDSVGADRYNQRLSQARAEAVREYLLTQGVHAAQVTAHGYGEAQPIANNSTAEGRAQNRRVVMKVLRNPGSVEVKGDGQFQGSQ